MKTTIKLLTVLTLALATFMHHSTASAAEVFKTTGEGVHAAFTTINGCITTEVFILVNEGKFQNPPSKGSPDSYIFLFISQYNSCTDTQLLQADAVAPLTDADFRISGRLKSATLNTTITVLDYLSNTSFDIFVDLAWTAIGPLSNQSSNFHFKTPGCISHFLFKDTIRLAEASGTISDGTTNFAPDPSVNAQFYSTKTGQVFIGCF